MSEQEPLEFIYCLKDDLSADILMLQVEEADMKINLQDKDFSLIQVIHIDTYTKDVKRKLSNFDETKEEFFTYKINKKVL